MTLLFIDFDLPPIYKADSGGSGIFSFGVCAHVLYEQCHEKKTLFLPYANNKGADQPVHPRNLISAFVLAS